MKGTKKSTQRTRKHYIGNDATTEIMNGSHRVANDVREDTQTKRTSAIENSQPLIQASQPSLKSTKNQNTTTENQSELSRKRIKVMSNFGERQPN